MVSSMLVLLVLFIVESVCGSTPRIVGGEVTSIQNYPYQVSIHYGNSLDCGGSIIGREWILTAAHCVYGKSPKSLKIRYGSSYSSKGGQLDQGIAQIIFHEFYDEDTFDYDIAVVKLLKPLTLSPTVRAVNLAKSPAVGTGSLAEVTGFGKMSASGSMSDVLKVLKVPIVDQKTCQEIYAMLNPVTVRMICAGHTTGGKDTCQGDSGGPLVQNGLQIGIVSWGNTCAKPGYPGVYTRVAALRDWIAKRTNI